MPVTAQATPQPVHLAPTTATHHHHHHHHIDSHQHLGSGDPALLGSAVSQTPKQVLSLLAAALRREESCRWKDCHCQGACYCNSSCTCGTVEKTDEDWIREAAQSSEHHEQQHQHDLVDHCYHQQQQPAATPTCCGHMGTPIKEADTPMLSPDSMHTEPAQGSACCRPAPLSPNPSMLPSAPPATTVPLSTTACSFPPASFVTDDIAQQQARLSSSCCSTQQQTAAQDLPPHAPDSAVDAAAPPVNLSQPTHLAHAPQQQTQPLLQPQLQQQPQQVNIHEPQSCQSQPQHHPHQQQQQRLPSSLVVKQQHEPVTTAAIPPTAAATVTTTTPPPRPPPPHGGGCGATRHQLQLQLQSRLRSQSVLGLEDAKKLLCPWDNCMCGAFCTCLANCLCGDQPKTDEAWLRLLEQLNTPIDMHEVHTFDHLARVHTDGTDVPQSSSAPAGTATQHTTPSHHNSNPQQSHHHHHHQLL
ncbi:hypothetical protein PTSG_11839 [Salpingoeca rosetta]|uniref:Uncharacterized protein n=1 Tax=Salpingoeca rosetta (strain ATCC 50818 / BSB-021) TaxID=946362 RepID=F2U1A0_SALR5|nr:uncharacterized protein PTSG_11839 [Salpingoeca rosetta]EGD81402.1 hypothetical protein PTSG_11839 [Salpingoeca rosetta]|eukprot:XP_004996606.1 hypothetical protein PTSG_11839 [Salpingoeca rosetta]